MMKYILIGVLAMILLSGCSSSPGSSSYASTMMINGDYYDAIGGQSQDYTIDKEIGEIEKNLPPEETRLKDDFVSNYLKEGTLIYSSKEDESVLLAKTEDGIQAFKRRP